MSQPGSSKISAPSLPTKVDIVSNKDKSKSASLIGGFIELRYYESILQDSIKANYMFADAGNSIDGQSVLEGLPLVGTEDVTLAFQDNFENKLEVKLNVNCVTPLEGNSGKNAVHLQLVSEEYIKNEESNMRLVERYSGKISDHVTSILKGAPPEQEEPKTTRSLKTKKKVDVEETSNNYNFLGNGRKPYYILNYLSKYSIPQGGEDDSAGYFFFETSEGYHFKSIDKLFDQEKKKSYVYTQSTDCDKGIPAGYDGKVLDYQADSGVNVQEKKMMGAYGTKIVMFNPFNCDYLVEEKTAEESKKVKLAGKALPVFNDKFENKSTRTTYYMVDSGNLPAGPTQEQIEANTEQNLDAVKTVNQAIRRYNQVFSGKMEITIAGDFSLHAGDVIFVDIPSNKAETDDTVDKQSGGLYIITDLCHLVNSDGTWTKLNLARDSFGRKGNHSNRT